MPTLVELDIRLDPVTANLLLRFTRGSIYRLLAPKLQRLCIDARKYPFQKRLFVEMIQSRWRTTGPSDDGVANLRHVRLYYCSWASWCSKIDVAEADEVNTN